MDTDFKVLMALMRLDIGGAETHVLELCKALKRRGVDVYVASNGGAYEAELASCGITHFRVPMHNKKLRNIFTSYARLRRIIKEHDIRLVHAHGRIPAFLCGLLRRRLHFRFVTTAHLDFKTNFPYNILSDWGEKSLAVSPDIKEYLIKNYDMKPEDILITVNGVDTDKFSPDTDCGDIMSEFGFSEQSFKIVSTSRMDTDRSLAARRLIECAAEICEHNPDTEIIIVGGGNDLDNVREQAEAANAALGRRVITLTGSRVDVNKFVALADIYVNVSRSVLEAMSAARPCIVAGNQGYIGIFSEGKQQACEDTNFCCRGCADTTAERLLSDIITLMDMDADARAALGAYGRRVITEKYSLDRMAQDALDLYELCRRSALQFHFFRKKFISEKSETARVDILISGYYGFRNNGDEAVLKSIIDSLLAKDLGLKITVLSMRPKLTSAAHGIRAVNRYNFPLIWRELKRTKLLITGGGSLIQDMTSTRSLMYYLLIIWLAMKRGAKTMLFANGIGPLHVEKNKTLTARLLNKADLITVRDERSVDVLRELGVDVPPIHFTSDIAFSLARTDGTAGTARLGRLGVSGGYFCIAIRSWKNLKHGFENQIAAFADHVCRTYALAPVFIPMQPTHDEDISRRVLGLMDGQGYYFGADYDLNEILDAIAGAEFVLGMRLHTVIYAAAAGVPVIGLVYDPKVQAMMEMLGQSSYMDVERLDLDTLNAFAKDILSSRGEISSAISQKSQAIGARALRSTELALELLNRTGF